MRVLVCFAGEHGSTKEIAERIAARLRRDGRSVELAAAEEVTSTAGYDAVVLGSAIHNAQWLPAAADLLHREAPGLAGRAVWLFSVGMVGDRGSAFGPRLSRFARRHQPVPDAVAALEGGPARHHRFTGVFRPEHASRVGRVVFRMMGGRYGDHRDWVDVDTWAHGIAAGLGTGAR